MKRHATTALLVTVLATAVASSQTESPASAVVVAVVESGGTLVPLGRFAEGRWHATWPQVDEQHIPPGLDAVPEAWLGIAIPREWNFWPADGGPPTSLSVVAPVYAGACVGTVGFTTTAPEADDGIAVHAPSADVRQLVTMSDQDPAVAPLVAVLRTALRDALPREIETWREDFGAMEAPSGDPEHAMELLTGRTTGSRTVVLARMTAVYRGVRLSDAVLPVGVRLTAWVEDEGGGPRVIATDAQSFRPDDDKSRRRRPIGIVTIAGSEFWIVEQTYYESRDFAIVEVSPGGVVDRVEAASESGC